MPINLYYTQKVRGFQQSHVEYFHEKAVYELKRTEQRCPKCGSKGVFTERMGERSIRGVSMGVCREVYLRHAVHRIYCHRCHERSMEHLPFLTGATKGLPTKEDLEADGVFHPNCTHSYSAVPDYKAEKDFGFKKDNGKTVDTSSFAESSSPEVKQEAPFGFWKGKKEQFDPKFDGNLTEHGKELEKQMKKSGIPAESRDEIHWNHTPEMQQLCRENPHVKGGSEWPGTTPGTRNMEIGSDPNTWEGCRQTITHEYGHYVANSIFDLVKNRDFEEFKAAVVSDWTATMKNTGLIKRFKGLADDWTAKEQMKDTLAKEKYGKDKFLELSLEQRWKITADADILGSISGGLYGFGHSSEVYIEDWYREAFANMYLVHKYNWAEFRERYPELWKYMENLTK